MLRSTAVLQTHHVTESGVPSHFQSVNFILELAFTYVELDLDLHSVSIRFIYHFILEIYL